MNALNLLWIIPAAFMAGYMLCGLMTANGERGDMENDRA